MKNPIVKQITITIDSAMQRTIQEAITLKEELKLVEAGSLQWCDLQDKLDDGYREIGFRLVKQLWL